MRTVNVAAAVIIRDGKIFATERGYGDYKDWWEFPGGKIEENESPRDAVSREIGEELGVSIGVGDRIYVIEYDYPDFHLHMEAFACTLSGGEIELREHENALWLDRFCEMAPRRRRDDRIFERQLGRYRFRTVISSFYMCYNLYCECNERRYTN